MQGKSRIIEKQSFKNFFLITLNYAQKHDLLFQFLIKVVLNKSKAYSFLIIGKMYLQKYYFQ